MDDQRRLVTAFALPVVETHISYVLFDHGTAYKIKKAVRFPFLDFTTLAAREFYCHEELRLNRRLAPSIYRDVVPITGTVDAPRLEGAGPAIEYAVRMRQFDQHGLLSRVIARDELTSERVDALALKVAAFHECTARAGVETSFGRLDGILDDARQNFAAMTDEAEDARRTALAVLREWTEREGARLADDFAQRKQQGCIRECHGDLHLGNIALIDGVVTLFDCIEFNPAMRWIDVMSDVAFLVMDLRDHHRPDLAARFLNGYLERTGDYDGLRVLRFYVVYRALVRAKVAWLRGDQSDAGSYLEFARLDTAPGTPQVVITHGVAGSGKSTRAQALVDGGAVRIRSDVERKRLAGLQPDARTGSETGGGLYTEDLTRQTYQRLATLARTIAGSGHTVVVDATFLKRTQRDRLRAVARELGLTFAIADCPAPVPVLKERIAQRLAHAHDPSEATLDVLTRQLASDEPLAADEQRLAM